MSFLSERGIAYCGLACVLCGCGEKDCPGCAAKCANGHDCVVAKCAIEKDLDGCYACAEYEACEKIPHNTKRVRAFNHYAQKYGKQSLIDRLQINNENGITYHAPGKESGDYDALETEGEIVRLIHFGTTDPYKKCPVIETESFTLRLVSEGDAEGLLVCYSDEAARKIFNADNCTSDFRYDTLDEMSECIHFWQDAYRQRYFVRFAIVDKQTGNAVGSVEMFGSCAATDALDGLWGVMRIDIASPYETEKYIGELLSVFNDENFYALFNVEIIITKAIPAATERIKALTDAGYQPFEWQTGREHYFIRRLNHSSL